jgi:DNA-directed RNA polymerase specialized sigma24 family protein
VSGGEHDFGAFVATRATSLLRVAYLACGDKTEAEDLLQAALERTYRNWDRVACHDNPEPYVRRVIINAAISRARRRAIFSIIPCTARQRRRPVRATPTSSMCSWRRCAPCRPDSGR